MARPNIRTCFGSRLFARLQRKHTHRPSTLSVLGADRRSSPSSPSSSPSQFPEAFRRILARKQSARKALPRSPRTAQPFFSPEHKLTVERRLELDRAIPRALQQSQTWIDLHRLSHSEEAGLLQYCEDVADRNSASALSHASPSGRRARAWLYVDRRTQTALSRGIERISPRNLAYISEKLHPTHRRHTLQIGQRIPPRTHSLDFRSRQHVQRPQASQVDSVYMPPLRPDGRRRSLSRKISISDLRSASEPYFNNPTDSADEALPAMINECPQAPFRRTRLQQRLPLLPIECSNRPEWVAEYLRIFAAEEKDQPAPFSHFGNNPYRWSAPVIFKDTIWSEQWAPAVTLETVQCNIHEIQEEHMHKEIHQYHYHNKIQPVTEYEILPPRHYVHVEGGGYAEIAEQDLPVGTPDAEWIVREVGEQLEQFTAAGQLNHKESKTFSPFTDLGWEMPLPTGD